MSRFFSTCLIAAVLAAGVITSSAFAQNVPCYKTQGGARQVIGSGCQLEILPGGVVTKDGIAQPTLRFAHDTVASGQTSKAVSLSGVTAASRCLASAAEVSTNAVYVRASVPGTNTVTVTTSADPGASGLDIVVFCLN